MSECDYRFLASLSSESGRPLGQSAISPDWFPATEAARFREQRRTGRLPAMDRRRIVPVWDGDAGMPYVRGVKVEVTESLDEGSGCLVPLTYFLANVQSVAATFVTAGKLKEGDTFHYRIAAFSTPVEATSAASASRPSWTIEEVAEPCVCGERSLADYRKAALPINDPDLEDYPVFIPPGVLEQAEALKIAANDKETGGILIGYLWRDTESTELFAEVTALVPAQHTVAGTSKLTFTPETWQAVQAAIQIRRRDEIFLAWHHTHPSRFWCRCGPEAQRQCPLGQQFFSSDDSALHRTVFSRAFHFALVTGDKPRDEGGWEMTHALYGWRNGIIVPRGFYLSCGRGAIGDGATYSAAHTSSQEDRRPNVQTGQ